VARLAIVGRLLRLSPPAECWRVSDARGVHLERRKAARNAEEATKRRSRREEGPDCGWWLAVEQGGGGKMRGAHLAHPSDHRLGLEATLERD